jgi:hypothetical protein
MFDYLYCGPLDPAQRAGLTGAHSGQGVLCGLRGYVIHIFMTCILPTVIWSFYLFIII